MRPADAAAHQGTGRIFTAGSVVSTIPVIPVWFVPGRKCRLLPSLVSVFDAPVQRAAGTFLAAAGYGVEENVPVCPRGPGTPHGLIR